MRQRGAGRAVARWWRTGLGGLLLAAAPLCALDPERAISQYVHAVWRAPQVLPHDGVTAIVESRDGYLWVGTVEGLARFDGVRAVTFDKSNTAELADNWVRCLLEDRVGRLWIGTLGGGLLRRVGERFERFGAAQGLPEDVVFTLHEDPAGSVWVGTDGGVYRLAGDTFERVAGMEALARASVKALATDRDGVLWIGGPDGLFRFDGNRASRLTAADGLTDDHVMALVADEGGLWIATERGGLVRLEGGRARAITPRDGLAHERVWSLGRDRDGNLWIGTDGGGLQRLTADGRLERFGTREGLPNDYVWAIREDRAGNLWVGTNGGGLSRLHDGAVVPWGSREGLPSDFVWCVRRATDGALWIGTEDAGLVRLGDGKQRRFTVDDGLPSNQVRSLLEDADGGLWIGTGAGLVRWRGGGLEPAVPELAGERIAALAADAGGRLWIGTGRGALWSLGDGRLLRYPQAEGASSGIKSLAVDGDGTVWAAASGGLLRLRAGVLTGWGLGEAGLPSTNLGTVLLGPDGAVWVVSRGGLSRLGAQGFATLDRRHGLFDEGLTTALDDGAGGLWLGTNRGLFRVEWAAAAAVLVGRQQRLESRVLGLADGLRSLELNGGATTWRDADGRLWFATRGGAAMVDPGRLARAVAPPQVHVEEVRVDDLPLRGAPPWRLPAGPRRIEIRYTGISLTAPEAVSFRRRLVGFDVDWVPAHGRRVADYTNLAHGRYRFEVLAANRDGIWSPLPATMAFEIAPRWHERLAVRLLAAAVFAVVGPVVYLVRVRRLRRQAQELERLVAERTAALEAANARLAQLSREDPLTGVANRRRFDEVLDEEWRRAYRQGEPLAVLLADVDYFKAYNDRHGHLAGDECLRTVGECLAATHRRAGELVARYGGEEFAVVVPGLPGERTSALAESLRGRVAALALPHPASPIASVVTISVGIAWAQPRKGGAPQDLVAAADRALYRAKGAGRNRVECELVGVLGETMKMTGPGA